MLGLVVDEMTHAWQKRRNAMDSFSALLLEEAETFEDRVEAITDCMARGVPLSEIETQLDEIDFLKLQLGV